MASTPTRLPGIHWLHDWTQTGAQVLLSPTEFFETQPYQDEHRRLLFFLLTVFIIQQLVSIIGNYLLIPARLRPSPQTVVTYYAMSIPWQLVLGLFRVLGYIAMLYVGVLLLIKKGHQNSADEDLQQTAAIVAYPTVVFVFYPGFETVGTPYIVRLSTIIISLFITIYFIYLQYVGLRTIYDSSQLRTIAVIIVGLAGWGLIHSIVTTMWDIIRTAIP